jgi:hypothetical protein
MLIFLEEFEKQADDLILMIHKISLNSVILF